MGLFQALLLAASLGWSSTVLGEPPNRNNNNNNGVFNPPRSSLPPSIYPPPPSSHPPFAPLSSTNDHFTSKAPVTLTTQSTLIYPSPITLTPASSLALPDPQPSYGGPPHDAPPYSQHSAPPPPGSSGGILIDTAPPPTAIQTYFINGHPIVAGHSATVIKGTTYSVAASEAGGRLFADGTPTGVSNAIVVAGTATVSASGGSGSGAGMRVAGATGSASASASGIETGNGGATFMIPCGLLAAAALAVGMGLVVL